MMSKARILTEKDIHKIRKDFIEKREIEERELVKLSKPIYDLVVEARFTITDVLNESYSTNIRPMSEIVVGGHSPSYEGGYTSKLTLRVVPLNLPNPVKELEFHGYSIVKAGDLILAKIPRYEEKKLVTSLFYGPFNTGEKIFLLDRDYNPLEKAIELTLLSPNGDVLRRERSVDYHRYVKC